MKKRDVEKEGQTRTRRRETEKKRSVEEEVKCTEEGESGVER
jgi:hypothetical protein